MPSISSLANFFAFPVGRTAYMRASSSLLCASPRICPISCVATVSMSNEPESPYRPPPPTDHFSSSSSTMYGSINDGLTSAKTPPSPSIRFTAIEFRMYFFSNILEGEVRNGGPCVETVCDRLLREGSWGDSVVDMHLVGRPFQGRRSVVWVVVGIPTSCPGH